MVQKYKVEHLETMIHGSETLGTLMCLSIGTPETINFPFVSNGKLMVFRCPNIQAHYNEYLNFGTPKNNEFSFGTKGKFIILGVPILKHISIEHLGAMIHGSWAKAEHFWET